MAVKVPLHFFAGEIKSLGSITLYFSGDFKSLVQVLAATITENASARDSDRVTEKSHPITYQPFLTLIIEVAHQ